MGTLIDASVLIAAQRGQIDLDAIVDAEGDDDVAIASACAAELLHAPHRLPTEVARTRAERAVEHLLGRFPILMFDMDIARVHARLAADLSARGTKVGAHDLMIAATALAREYRIATRDVRSFPKIPGLDVVRW
jgi:predicted nucleic acid-binding protein